MPIARQATPDDLSGLDLCKMESKGFRNARCLNHKRTYRFFTDQLWRTSDVPAAPLVTYIRVSTSGQGRSGLGIEAQRHALAHFAAAEGYEVVREFVEVETGKGADA